MSKIIRYDVNKNCLDISLKKGHYTLNIKAKSKKGLKLSAPVKGKMQKDILESLSAEILVSLKKIMRLFFMKPV